MSFQVTLMSLPSATVVTTMEAVIIIAIAVLLLCFDSNDFIVLIILLSSLSTGFFSLCFCSVTETLQTELIN